MAASFVFILDYCGGKRTDHLVEQLQLWNPGHSIHVLDNASPREPSRYATHSNSVNSYVGGGIRDCLVLAHQAGARFVIFIVNDVECLKPINLSHFERLIAADPRVVQVSAAITQDTAQARIFPWMVDDGTECVRVVPHADFLFTLLDIPFIMQFGGFPASKGGWFYDWEFAWHAKRSSRLILVTPEALIRHNGEPQDGGDADVIREEKRAEAVRVYGNRYGGFPWADLRRDIRQSRSRGLGRVYRPQAS